MKAAFFVHRVSVQSTQERKDPTSTLHRGEVSKVSDCVNTIRVARPGRPEYRVGCWA